MSSNSREIEDQIVMVFSGIMDEAMSIVKQRRDTISPMIYILPGRCSLKMSLFLNKRIIYSSP
jgi:hypothetical protein